MAVKKSSSKTKRNTNNSDIKELKEQVLFLKEQLSSSSSNQLKNNIEELNEQITKLVSININLQSKMTELLIKVTDLIRENRELVSLLEEASDGEQGGGTSNEGLLVELRKIENNTNELYQENSKLVEYIKRMYTKSLLSSAMNGNVNEEKTMPLPSEERTIGNI